MDKRGDHALICKHGVGVVYRQNSLCNAIAWSSIKPAGIRFTAESPSLVEGRSFRPVDILAQCPSPPPGEAHGKPTAYAVNGRHACNDKSIFAAASRIAGAAELTSLQKVRRLEMQLLEAGVTSAAWDFVSLAFDTPGAPSRVVSEFSQEHGRRIAFKSSVPMSDAQHHIKQVVSYLVWSTTAPTILLRLPSLGARPSLVNPFLNVCPLAAAAPSHY